MSAADSEVLQQLQERLAAQRAAFDHSFALPVTLGNAARVDLIALRIGGDRFALPLQELAELQRGRRIVALPGASAELLGIAGIRGRAVAVYDLARLLGYSGASGERWLALSAGAEPLAFAFDGFEGLRQVAPAAISASSGGAHVRGVAHLDSGAYALVSVVSLVAAQRERVAGAPAPA